MEIELILCIIISPLSLFLWSMAFIDISPKTACLLAFLCSSFYSEVFSVWLFGGFCLPVCLIFTFLHLSLKVKLLPVLSVQKSIDFFHLAYICSSFEFNYPSKKLWRLSLEWSYKSRYIWWVWLLFSECYCLKLHTSIDPEVICMCINPGIFP